MREGCAYYTPSIPHHTASLNPETKILTLHATSCSSWSVLNSMNSLFFCNSFLDVIRFVGVVIAERLHLISFTLKLRRSKSFRPTEMMLVSRRRIILFSFFLSLFFFLCLCLQRSSRCSLSSTVINQDILNVAN